MDFNAVGRASFGAGHEARDDDWRDAAAEPEMEGNGRFRTCLARIWLICGVLFPAGSLGAFPHADPRSIDPDVPMRPVLAVGVVAFTAVQGESVEIATVGVYLLPKNASAVIAQGTRVAWDATEKRIDLPGTGLDPVGIATEAAGDGVTTARVRLDGVATEVA